MKKRLFYILFGLLFVLNACKGSDVTLQAVFVNANGEGVTTISLASEAEAIIRYKVSNADNTQVNVQASFGAIASTTGNSVRYIAPKTTKAKVDPVVITSLADPSQTLTLTVNVTASNNTSNNIAVAITPTTSTSTSGKEVVFSAEVTGLEEDDARGVTWSSNDLQFKRETASNVVIVAPEAEGNYIIRATSKQNGGRWAEARLTVDNPVTVAIAPETVTLAEEAQQVFTATVTGTDDKRVTWTVAGGDNSGSLNIQGESAIYKAPNKGGVFLLTVRSVADTSQSAQATITVNDDGQSDVKVTVTPTVVNIGTRESLSFSATVTGAENKAVTWEVSDGTIVVEGNTANYTAPDSAGTYTITATSEADKDVKTSVNITVAEVAVTVDPTTAKLKPGQTVAITATVAGAQNTSVAWQGENITTNGNTAIYTAPSKEGTYIVKAVSNADNRRSAQTVITVEEDVKVRLEPETLELGVGETKRIRAIVTGDSNTNVTWNASQGIITGTGATVDYRAPNNAGSYTITATSEADTSKNATAVVTVSDIAIQVSPSSVTLNQGETQSFRATVTGASDKTVTWSANDGTIAVNGNQVTYTAPARVGNYLLTAKSNANASTETSVTITVR